jgi:hypothetical protein
MKHSKTSKVKFDPRKKYTKPLLKKLGSVRNLTLATGSVGADISLQQAGVC